MNYLTSNDIIAGKGRILSVDEYCVVLSSTTSSASEGTPGGIPKG